MADKLITTKNNRKDTKKDYVFAVGRRREAVARVRLYSTLKADAVWNELPLKKGELYVNEKPISEYFPDEVEAKIYNEPLRVVNALNKYALTIQVRGGGKTGKYFYKRLFCSNKF